MPEPQTQAPVRPGDVLAGKYRVERVLGVGGMGVVVAALHLQLDERVALKFLLPEALTNEEAVARFAREARAAVKIKSEHVARVSDVGNLEDGAPYMVMEYLEGQDLSQVLEQRGPLPCEEAITYVLQACEALAEAHALGIVHRDLKPSNLFLARRPDGRSIVKVLDFGISKVTSGMEGAAMTRTTSVMGSPLYMSPEQMAASRDVDPRTDIWAIGAVLYQLLTASAPFMADTMPELCAKILTAPASSLRHPRPDAPPDLEAVIFRCLEKNRDHRFPTIAHLAAALAPFAPSARLSVERIQRVLGVMDPMVSTRPPTTDPMPYPPQFTPHHHPHPHPPPGAIATGGSWGITSSQLGERSSLGMYLLVGAAGMVAAFLLVLVIFLKFGSSQASADVRPSAPTAETTSTIATVVAPAVESAPVPPLATPTIAAPTIAAPLATHKVAPPPATTLVLPLPPTINVVIQPPPTTTQTAAATPTKPPPSARPDIF